MDPKSQGREEDASPFRFFLPIACSPRDFAVQVGIPEEDAVVLFKSGAFPSRELPGGGLVASKYAIVKWLESRDGADLRVLPRGEDSAPE